MPAPCGDQAVSYRLHHCCLLMRQPVGEKLKSKINFQKKIITQSSPPDAASDGTVFLSEGWIDAYPQEKMYI